MPDPQPHTCPAVSHRRARGTNGGGRCQGQVIACERWRGSPFPRTPGAEPVDDPRWGLSRRLQRNWSNSVTAGLTLRSQRGQKRTLTNLYNALPTWLELAHKKLDEAVFAAYGWPSDLSDEEILERLLALNLERAGKG